ncbi:MAG: DUF3054 domain-containing protein [Propionibacteriaceae bacterium]
MQTPVAVALDTAVVLAFTTVGRIFHHESMSPMKWWQTAWPFLAGLALGWTLIITTGLRRSPLFTRGMIVCADTLLLGMLLRALTQQGTALPFVCVAVVFLVVMFLGWRMVWWLIAGKPPHRPRRY